ncbi:transposase [Tistrella bauzanensis]|uniref:transposase n=1 Tax=Tistrella bauzanensis TaxID=657419 RepID=UPI00166BB83E
MDRRLSPATASTIHILTDTFGRPHTLVLTAGNASDMTGTDLFLPRMPKTRYLIADKGYDADRLREALRGCGTVPVIRGRTN